MQTFSKIKKNLPITTHYSEVDCGREQRRDKYFFLFTLLDLRNLLTITTYTMYKVQHIDCIYQLRSPFQYTVAALMTQGSGRHHQLDSREDNLVCKLDCTLSIPNCIILANQDTQFFLHIQIYIIFRYIAKITYLNLPK